MYWDKRKIVLTICKQMDNTWEIKRYVSFEQNKYKMTLRNQKKYKSLKANTKRYKQSALPYMRKLLNDEFTMCF